MSAFGGHHEGQAAYKSSCIIYGAVSFWRGTSTITIWKCHCYYSPATLM